MPLLCLSPQFGSGHITAVPLHFITVQHRCSSNRFIVVRTRSVPLLCSTCHISSIAIQLLPISCYDLPLHLCAFLFGSSQIISASPRFFSLPLQNSSYRVLPLPTHIFSTLLHRSAPPLCSTQIHYCSAPIPPELFLYCSAPAPSRLLHCKANPSSSIPFHANPSQIFSMPRISKRGGSVAYPPTVPLVITSSLRTVLLSLQ